MKTQSGKQTLNATNQQDEFLIGDHDEHPGTQREDPSAFTTEGFADGGIDPHHIRQASKTQRLSVSAKNDPYANNESVP